LPPRRLYHNEHTVATRQVQRKQTGEVMEHVADIGNLIGLAFAMMLLAGADWIEEKVASARATNEKSDIVR
jgi:hypothetical protein